jgi:hypothetical protein
MGNPSDGAQLKVVNVEEEFVQREVLTQVLIASGKSNLNIEAAADAQGCFPKKFFTIGRHGFSNGVAIFRKYIMVCEISRL